MSLSITNDDAVSALVAFIHDILPQLGVTNVRQGQDNRVPMPVGPNFVIIIPSARAQLATTTRDYRPTDGARDTTRSTRVEFEVNLYGPDSTDNAQIFATLFRDLYGCDQMKPTGMQPLWCDDGRQLPLVDGERQYEQRWMVRASLQANPTVSTTQQFADSVAVTIVEADRNGG